MLAHQIEAGAFEDAEYPVETALDRPAFRRERSGPGSQVANHVATNGRASVLRDCDQSSTSAGLTKS